MSLADEWDELELDGARLVGYVVLVRNDFLEAHPEAVEEFLQEQRKSVEVLYDDPSSLVEAAWDYRVMLTLHEAEKGLLMCYPECITGTEMRDVLGAYLNQFLLYGPTLVGDAIPGDDFYYLGPDAEENAGGQTSDDGTKGESAIDDAAVGESTETVEETTDTEAAEAVTEEAAQADGAANQAADAA